MELGPMAQKESRSSGHLDSAPGMFWVRGGPQGMGLREAQSQQEHRGHRRYRATPQLLPLAPPQEEVPVTTHPPPGTSPPSFQLFP